MKQLHGVRVFVILHSMYFTLKYSKPEPPFYFLKTKSCALCVAFGTSVLRQSLPHVRYEIRYVMSLQLISKSNSTPTGQSKNSNATPFEVVNE